MRITKSVLFSLFLSLLLLNGSHHGFSTGAPARETAEPGGPVGAVATLVAVHESAEGRRALLKIHLVAHEVDAEATVFQLDPDGKTLRGPAIARASLPKGEPRSVQVEADVQADRETRLFYRVKVHGVDGSFSELNLYNRVPPDDPDECVTVGDYIQCQGVVVPEVQP